MSTIYISGPMTGIADHNFPAFRQARADLEAAGHEVLDPSRYGADPEFSWADYLRRDLSDVLAAEAVALLPGWERSRGAQLEAHVARMLGMPCLAVADVLSGGLDAASQLPAHKVLPRTADVAEWTLRNFGEHDAPETVLGLAEETGELCRAALKRDQGIRGTHEQWTAEIRKEVGDVVIKAHDLAGVEGFDLDDAVAERWAEISQRDWTTDRIGHGMPA